MESRGAKTEVDLFGTLDDGRDVQAVRLDNGCGVVACIITYGARLQSLVVPDSKGHSADVVLGFSDLGGYLSDPNYLGATVGRWANRIADAEFSLDGERFTLRANDRGNSLHGGERGFSSQLWEIVDRGEDCAMVAMALTSPDGEEGFPGAVSAKATFTLDSAGRLTIDYEAVSDRRTILNLTHHSYWNLAGEASGRDAREQLLEIRASHFLPIRPGGIPTGELRAVADTSFDFTVPRQPLNHPETDDQQLDVAGGYDHCWVLDGGRTSEPRQVASLRDPDSGRTLDIWSDQPGLQFYAGNFLTAEAPGNGGRIYQTHDGIALEPQLFPDTPNRPAFGSAVVEPGETYRNRSIWHLYCA
ncbi:aldose epimerase family protein [Citromicrobium bathyomarinum]|uniref:aldose epimerase family protein n=1 Tax=Citromicrobium bathyomarinum TaxID=72174 RepID=UPI00315AF730